MQKLLCLILLALTASSCSGRGTMAPIGQQRGGITPQINQGHGHPNGWEFLKTKSMNAAYIIALKAHHVWYDSPVDNTVGVVDTRTLKAKEFPIPNGSGFTGSNPAQLFGNFFTNEVWVALTGGDPSIAEYTSNGTGTLHKVSEMPAGGICGFGKNSPVYLTSVLGNLVEYDPSTGSSHDVAAIPGAPFVQWLDCRTDARSKDASVDMDDSFNNQIIEFDLVSKKFLTFPVMGVPAQTTVDSAGAIWMTINNGPGVNSVIGEIPPGGTKVIDFNNDNIPDLGDAAGITPGKPGTNLIWYNNGDGVISSYNTSTGIFNNFTIPGTTFQSVLNGIALDDLPSHADGNIYSIGSTPGKIVVELEQKITLTPSALTIKKSTSSTFTFSETNYAGGFFVVSLNKAVATVVTSGTTVTVTGVGVGTTAIEVSDLDGNEAFVSVTVTP